MLNIAVLLSTVGLFYGIIGNYVRGVEGYIELEFILILVNISLGIWLRMKKDALDFVATIMTAQYTFFFLFLVYVGEPEDLKHIWLFTYSIILLYFQGTKKGFYWFMFLISMLLIAPLQGFVDVAYNLYQMSYISFVMVVISIIIHFYQIKMQEAKGIILQQQQDIISTENILKKELHHRIKNNMQFIISLFKLRLHPHMNDDIKRVIKEISSKIKGMSIAHDMLYSSKALMSIDTKEYFLKLIDALKNGYTLDNVEFNVSVKAELNGEQIIYAGLIANEVIINALKYAFDSKGGVINLELFKEGDTTVIKIGDNGKGMSGCQISSFGSDMIRSLAENELKARMEVTVDSGVCYSFYIM